ncbi:hypothetical protein NH8B_2793 [Pseudogulbenkiania sp. NH8B]|uniref:hypothetical protein n=1 Tax=Pseudogulbenkiania sp. (strain NH8B) TaxID=748280 RepID=UPI0002279C4B|nr:hypothetical protein [Pseudogulbenkiania sp. NH8B]BAK77586.1 hypothetical protein NH8B_2793 [Pseudogulbenkiania sp. NH8B]
MNMHTKPDNFPVLSPRASGTLTTVNRQEIVDFTRDLADAVKDIGLAAKQSSDVKEKVGSLMFGLQNQSLWGKVTSGLSGSTDKELAILVQGLGTSLSITQKVLQVVLKVMTQKNQVLHAFNEALVKKIAMVCAGGGSFTAGSCGGLLIAGNVSKSQATCCSGTIADAKHIVLSCYWSKVIVPKV